MPYKDYLMTPHWREFREKALAHHGAECQCGRTTGLQIHHRSYANVGCELLTDVEVLCRYCHLFRHKKTRHLARGRRRKKKKGRKRH